MTIEQEIGLVPRGRKDFRQIDYSALDRQTVEQSLTDYILSSFPEQQDTVESTGFKIITREIAYVADLLSYRADYLANNNYLATSTNIRAVDNLLALIGYRRNSVNAAVTDVAIVPRAIVGIAPTFDDDGTLVDAGDSREVRIPARTTISGPGTDGSQVSFELFASPDNIFDDIVIPSGAGNVIAHAKAGLSKTFRVQSNGSRFMQVILPDLGVITDDIRVNVGEFEGGTRGTEYEPNVKDTPEWERVDYLVTRSRENIYEVKLRNDGATVLTFGDGNFGNIIPKGQDIIINYRIGGGDSGNVLPEALEGGGNFSIYEGDLRTPDSTSVSMLNVTRGVGGTSEETIEEAKFLAPLVYQAQGRAVKDIDYTAFALNHPSVSKAVAIARQPIVMDAVQDLQEYTFQFGGTTTPYTIKFDVHRFDLRETIPYQANIIVPKQTYTSVDEMLIDLNLQLGWEYDPEGLAFRESTVGQAFIAHFDKSIEGFIELWIHTGNYQARATLKDAPNNLLPLLMFSLGTYGRVDANYVDLHILTYAEDNSVAVPNTALVNELRTYFEEYKEIQTEVIVRRGYIQRVDVSGHVYVQRAADPKQVEDKVDEAVRNLFLSDNREIGEPLYVSKIFEAIEAVEGVAYLDQFTPSQNVFPDDKTLLQLGNFNVTFYEARR